MPTPPSAKKAAPRQPPAKVPGGDRAVKAFIADLTGWKGALAARIDAVVIREAWKAVRAVK